MITPIKQTGPECLLAVFAMLADVSYQEAREIAKDLLGRRTDWTGYMNAAMANKTPINDDYVLTVMLLNDHFGVFNMDDLELFLMRCVAVNKTFNFHLKRDGKDVTPDKISGILNGIFGRSLVRIPKGKGALFFAPWLIHALGGSTHIVAYENGWVFDPADGSVNRGFNPIEKYVDGWHVSAIEGV